ncbi:Aste57867_19378 [Aphanomyces stellatus]|uniref:Aste57867_19378 protein n=1 Tax=Aphanomyces stellatus TaxID=120398 RepID=A0A485LGN2_9STRA|nr:hypothetical protein As57867_019314 [Aphanomyces stellatus]VFT96092.1 Aste57867_19378 [Aphanomyces stellatus]
MLCRRSDVEVRIHDHAHEFTPLGQHFLSRTFRFLSLAVMAFLDKFNLEKQVSFYLSYHSNPINKLLHLVCIWPILLSAVFLLCLTPPFVDQPLDSHHYVVVNYAFVAVLVYVVWYVILDPLAGSLAASFIIAMFCWSNHLIHESLAATGETPWKTALAIHIAAWIIQFIGHGFFEKRAPALLDSWDQAIITAPLFVLLEILLPLGYRRDMNARVEKQVSLNVAKFRREQIARKAKAG